MKHKLWILLLTVLMIVSFCFSLTACQQDINYTQGGDISGDNSDGSTVCVHTYTESITLPTCKERGFTTYTCSKCGDTYRDNYTVGEHTGVGTCLKCGDNFYFTLTTYIVSHADNYSEAIDAYTIMRSFETSGYDMSYMIQLYGDGRLSLNAVIIPLTDGTVTPILFSMDISEIDGSYDWEYSCNGDMEGTIYSATLMNDTQSLLYLSTDISSLLEIKSAQQISAICAKGLIELLADVAVAADECLTLDNFGFVSYSYIPTEYVPGDDSWEPEEPQFTPVESVSLNFLELSIKKGEETVLTASVLPSNATNQTVLWSSSDETVATVVDGHITAVGRGTATITATTQDGNKSASCAVMVYTDYELLRTAIEESGGKVSVGVLLGASITLENRSDSIYISLDATQTVMYTSSTSLKFRGNIYEGGTSDGYAIYSTITYSGIQTTSSLSTTAYFDFSMVDLGTEFEYYVEFDSSSYTQDRLSFDITYSGSHMTTTKSYVRDILSDVVDGLTDLRKIATNPTYTITYNANGGHVSSVTQSVKYEGNCVLLTPTRDGYDFVGWYYDGSKITSGKWLINRDVTLVAQWAPKTYQIVYLLENGVNHVSNPTTYETGMTFTLFDPSKTGYAFLGWTGNGISTPTKNLQIKSSDYGDKTFTANWSTNTYDVTFNADGGQCSTQTAKYTYDSFVTLPVPTRTDYDFVGWYNGITKVENGTWKIADNCTLTAKWELKRFSINYELNGGENNSLNPNAYTKETEVTLFDPTRTGYSFIGWTTDGISTPTKTIKIEKGSVGTKTFTANWEANTYTAIFDKNGGVCDIETQDFIFDESCSLPTPTRIGYTFEGWYYNNSKVSSVWNIAQDCTLMAKWSANTDTVYIVNHYQENADDDNYTLYATQNLTGTSDSLVTPEVNTYEGFTSPDRQTVSVAPDGSLVVDYYYTRNYYTISFVTNGGQQISEISKKYQSTSSLPNGVRKNYTFGGWFTDIELANSFDPSEMEAKDQTVYAWWREENKPTDFIYKKSSKVMIVGYIGISSTMWIPSYIGGAAVYNISSGAFINQDHLTKVIVPDTVEYIEKEAFKGCNSIEDITLPFVGYSLNATDYEAVFGYIFGFETKNAYELGWQYDGATNQRIGTYIVKEDKSVLFENIKIGTANSIYNPVDKIWQYSCYDKYYSNLLYGNYCLQSYYYNIPTTLKTVTITLQTDIPVAAFNNCSFIETINLPCSVEDYGSIGAYAFQNCSATINYSVIPTVGVP